ncbi:MAG: hypothetical protein WCR54_02475 [Clostridia bacterium]
MKNQQILFSRRNKVVLNNEDGIKKIIKTYADKERCQIEYQTLLDLPNSLVPKVLEKGEKFICLEYIEGELLLDEFLKADTEKAKELAIKLANFINDFRTILRKKIPNDENFRNYIITKNNLYRIDLEQTSNGTLEQYLAQVISFATLHSQVDEVCVEFSHTLIQATNPNLANAKNDYTKYLTMLAYRWKVPFPQELYNKVLERNCPLNNY